MSPDSPAEAAGLKAGDVIIDLSSGITSSYAVHAFSVEDVQNFIGASAGKKIDIAYDRRGGEEGVEIATVIPESGIVPDRGAIGISLDLIGTVRLPFHKAFLEGGKTTGRLLSATAQGLGNLALSAVKGDADLSQVSGPVGIVGMVGDAAKEGFLTLLMFAAIISLNLAIINLVPFPALDGGRLLFVAIEAIIRRPLPQKITLWANGIGFSLLLLLMVIVTVSDVVKLFS